MKRQYYKTLLIFYYLIILFFSFKNFSYQKQLIFFFKYDEIFHFIQYFTLGLLLIKAFLWNLSIKNFLLFMFIITSSSLFTEYGQYFIPGRIPSSSDFFYNILGSSSAFILYRTRAC